MRVRRRLSALIAVALVSVAGLVITPSAAHAIDNPWEIIPVSDTSKCIDNPNSSPDRYTQMIIYTCNSGANQDWYFIQSKAYANGWWLKNGAANQYCMTTLNAATTSNTPVVQYPCTDGANEVWQAVPVGIEDTYQLRPQNAATGANLQCLTLQNASTANRTRLILFTCNGGLNQYWTWHLS
jgi:hypothetical protein